MTELLPPNAADIERVVLCEMLIEPEACATAISLLNEDCFYRQNYSIIFSAIKKLYRRDGAVDIYLLVNFISDAGKLNAVGGEASILGIYNETASAANIHQHCRILTEKWKLRSLVNLATLIETRCNESGQNSRLIIAEIENNLSAILKNEVVKQKEEIESW